MSPQLQRAILLFQQSRHEPAENELRQALAEDPDDAYAHALLGLCLSEREQFREATAEAEQAVHLAPDFPFSHFALAHVLHDRHREHEALAAITEAIRLDASEADQFALLSEIQLNERRWPAALEAAERGLELDPEHVGCTNLRAIALVKLGRKAEAGATIDSALSRNPANSLTHANQGWTLLERGDSKKALEHFREALRLNPENEWARRGIVEALKARNLVYALMLRYFLWISKLSRRGQWAIVVGGYLGIRALGSVGRANPNLAPWILPIQIFYVCFALMSWIADPLFNLMLRVHRFGRLALSRQQTVASNWIGGCILLALVALGGWVVSGFNGLWLLSSLVPAFLLVPLAGTFKCASGWPRKTMAVCTGLVALAGVSAVLLFVFADGQPREEVRHLTTPGENLLTTFIIGSLGSTWIVNFLLMHRPKR
jgi:Flp pilus assembly protein TadD